tara:strand:- start:6725 stop:8317 length:1593 start_codon:yes stop_codon:yes gene_type:complete
LNKYLVVDYRIAAKYKSNIFDKNFKWPVNHSFYDDTFRIFYDWIYDFPSIIGKNEKLKLIFELIELNLLEYLGNIFGVLVDVNISEKEKLKLAYDKNYSMYSMILNDNFDEKQEDKGYKQYIKNFSDNFLSTTNIIKNKINDFRITKEENIFFIRKNNLLSELMKSQGTYFRIQKKSLENYRNNNKVDKDIKNLGYLITEKFINVCKSREIHISKNLNFFLSNKINNMLINAYSDFNYQETLALNPDSILLTGSGGDYITRLASLHFFKNGNKVIRMTHGGDSVFFNDPSWTTIELPFITEYISYGIESSKINTSKINNHITSRNNSNKIQSFAGGSKFHEKILEKIAYEPNKEIKNITIINASFGDKNRAIPNIKIHDVIYYEWQLRLSKRLTNLGYNTISKRHPKGQSTNDYLFKDVVSTEKLSENMSSTFDYTDVYIFDIFGGAFIEALCTLKPIIFIEMPNRLLNKKTKDILKKSVSIISSRYNDNNLIEIDFDELFDSINNSVNVNERLRLISDFITSRNYTKKY